jgi:hypothetical protein
MSGAGDRKSSGRGKSRSQGKGSGRRGNMLAGVASGRREFGRVVGKKTELSVGIAEVV